MATPFWYNAALALLKPIYQSRIRKRAEHPEQLQQELLERFGPFQPAKNLHAIWFHVVSVGETNAAQPLIEHYLKAGHPVLVTNTTKTGQARAKSLFLKAPYLDLFQAVYLPADQVHLIREFYQKYQPKLLALVETELWPNLIDQAQHFQVPCLLINARLSEKSAKGYAKVARLTKQMLSELTLLITQHQSDAERFKQLGMPVERILVSGSIKFDIQVDDTTRLRGKQLREQLGGRFTLILASSHEDEEAQLLAVISPLWDRYPDLLVILVPRHPERFESVYQTALKCSDHVVRRSGRSQSLPDATTRIYLGDTMGDMMMLYAAADIVVMGGSFVNVGGHNPLEPAVLGMPVVMGPHHFNFAAISDAMTQAGGMQRVQQMSDVTDVLLAYIQDPEMLEEVGNKALQYADSQRGALDRLYREVSARLLS